MEWITDHWELIALVLAGGWLAKIKATVSSFCEVVRELGETRDKLTKALADKEITREEMAEIAKEMEEDLVAIHKLSADAMSIIPPQIRKKLPFQVSGK